MRSLRFPFVLPRPLPHHHFLVPLASLLHPESSIVLGYQPNGHAMIEAVWRPFPPFVSSENLSLDALRPHKLVP